MTVVPVEARLPDILSRSESDPCLHTVCLGACYGGAICVCLQFSTVEDAVHACILMHNLDVNGNLLYVTFSDAVPGL